MRIDHNLHTHTQGNPHGNPCTHDSHGPHTCRIYNGVVMPGVSVCNGRGFKGLSTTEALQRQRDAPGQAVYTVIVSGPRATTASLAQ